MHGLRHIAPERGWREMSQPPGAPPGQWKERKDVVSRAVIEHLDAARADIVEAMEAKLDERLRSHVTWQGLAGSFVGLLGLVATLVFSLVAPVKESAAATRQEARESRKDLAEEVKEFKRDSANKLDKIDARVEGMWQAGFEGKPKAEVREAVNKKTQLKEK